MEGGLVGEEGIGIASWFPDFLSADFLTFLSINLASETDDDRTVFLFGEFICFFGESSDGTVTFESVLLSIDLFSMVSPGSGTFSIDFVFFVRFFC